MPHSSQRTGIFLHSSNSYTVLFNKKAQTLLGPMLTVVFSSVATERWRLSHVLPWGECVTQSQMVTFPSGDLFSVFVVVWRDGSCKAP